MEDNVSYFPAGLKQILQATKMAGFDQWSDPLLGSLLSTLAATKPNGRFLELGTGSGIATAWILRGLSSGATLNTIDNDERLSAIAKQHLGSDPRVQFLVGKGEELIVNTEKNSIDFIFADAWPGKYCYLEETLSLLRDGGIYLVDDMTPRDSWPEGHADKADNLIQVLESREELLLTKMSWSSGLIICTKKP